MNKEELINERCKEAQEEGACFGCCFECPIKYGRGLTEDWYDDEDEDFGWDDEEWDDKDWNDEDWDYED